MKSIELYTQLITKIDEFEKKLFAAYSPHIRCARGCSACCILESVFPVEAWNIYTTLDNDEGRESIRSSGGESGRCVFLDGGLCSIYRCRPVICRTHGYPILAEGRVDFCPENFREIKNIDSGYILDIEALNRALVSVNLVFDRENSEKFFSSGRVSLAALKQRIFLNN